MSDLPQDIPQESPENDEINEQVSRNLLDDATPDMGDKLVSAASSEATIPTSEDAWNANNEAFETAFKAADTPEALQKLLTRNEQDTQAVKGVIARIEENLKEKQKLMFG